MAQTLEDVMTRDPVMCDDSTSLADAARLMRDYDIGDVLVSDSKRQLCGIVTDRDIVVRCVAAGTDPTVATLAEMCTNQLATVGPEAPVETASQLMREMAVRRLPVVDQGQRPDHRAGIFRAHVQLFAQRFETDFEIFDERVGFVLAVEGVFVRVFDRVLGAIINLAKRRSQIRSL